jgi:hypothetical protein
VLNEGIIINDTKNLLKSEMIRQIHRLRSTDPEAWSRSVFEGITKMSLDDVDWNFQDNKAGFYTWIRSFDQLVVELIADGYIREVEDEVTGHMILEPTRTDPPIEYSHQVYPAR